MTIVRPAGSQLLSWAQRWDSSAPALGTLSLDSTVVPSIGTGVPLRLMSDVTSTWRVRLLAAVAFWDRELSAPAVRRLEQQARALVWLAHLVDAANAALCYSNDHAKSIIVGFVAKLDRRNWVRVFWRLDADFARRAGAAGRDDPT